MWIGIWSIMNINNFEVPKRDNFFESIYSKAANKLTPYFLNFTANEVTIISGIFGIIGSFFLISDNYFHLIIASIFIQLFSILDLVDGNIARRNHTQSKFGMWLDIFFDKLIDFLIIFLSTFGIYKNFNDPNILVWGIIWMGSVLWSQIIMILNTSEKYFEFSRVSGSKFIDPTYTKNSKLGFFLIPLYFYRRHLSYQHNTFLFLISFFAIINQLTIGIYFLTIHAVISLILSNVINFVRIKKN